MHLPYSANWLDGSQIHDLSDMGQVLHVLYCVVLYFSNIIIMITITTTTTTIIIIIIIIIY